MDALIRKKFPNIDEDLMEYVSGCLADLSLPSVEDVHEAIGEMLVGSVEGCTEEVVLDLCREIAGLCLRNRGATNVDGLHQALSAPVQLGAIAQAVERDIQEASSIFMKQTRDVSNVDQKRLEKAEAKIRQKNERRATQKPTTSAAEAPVLQEASANQVVNKRDMKQNGKVTDIHLDNVDLTFGEKVLLENASVVMSFGRRYGLVGRNGMGKSTLLRAIASRSLRIPPHISVLHVEQEVVGDNTSALDSVLECDVERKELLQREQELTGATRDPQPVATPAVDTSGELMKIYARLAELEADQAPAKASRILAGLGFSPSMQQQPTKQFSGGWRMRLALARALFAQPDLLLLDEPTNMLDLRTVLWLEQYLQSWPTTILVVSHDRSFLRSVATDIIHLFSRDLSTYKGDYDIFMQTKEERLRNQQREYEAQQQYRQHLQDFIDRWRYNAKRAPQAQSKIKILQKLPVIKPVIIDPDVVLRFPSCEELQGPLVQLSEVTFAYTPERTIFSNVDLTINAQSRIAVVGANGAGKTTLLKILLEELSPTKGVRSNHRNLSMAYFSQHHVDSLSMQLSSLDLFRERFSGCRDEVYRQHLGSYGVSGELATRPIATLSGGQKSRVAFAVMTWKKPNMLILDEPTNHLDVETVEALGRALVKFPGGVVLVSHDETLIDMVMQELWVCGDGSVKSLEGGLKEYRKRILAEIESGGL
ncbi:ATP-binding cassette sub-family F member 3-like [Sycon ciliatum]|uniref:ATP-binding cassette sub-family F member 3-like n=1 Tax=Sycon ciliatum TaxID=27933 RepID=UPI0020ABBBFD|eukprot:scpid47774/ scgid18158/ ATP-binding cassette sub-family F member 3